MPARANNRDRGDACLKVHCIVPRGEYGMRKEEKEKKKKKGSFVKAVSGNQD